MDLKAYGPNAKNAVDECVKKLYQHYLWSDMIKSKLMKK
mgnify:CR=1 FL=1